MPKRAVFLEPIPPELVGIDGEQCAECWAPCELHGQRECSTCHKHPGECSFGDCENPATVRRGDGNEVREFCAECAELAASLD